MPVSAALEKERGRYEDEVRQIHTHVLKIYEEMGELEAVKFARARHKSAWRNHCALARELGYDQEAF